VHGSGLEAAQVVHAALKAGARALGLGNTVSEHDLHIHYVDTELHKDGPSAGLALALACVSALRGRALPPMLAASGELTLHGGVRSVAGLHEKLTAARLHGVTRVLLPAATLFDVRALSPDVTRGLTLAFVDSIQQAVATVWPAGEATP
jgi:ATP-dependent Lon protease